MCVSITPGLSVNSFYISIMQVIHLASSVADWFHPVWPYVTQIKTIKGLKCLQQRRGSSQPPGGQNMTSHLRRWEDEKMLLEPPAPARAKLTLVYKERWFLKVESVVFS